jgi:hypothetical protein
MEDQTRDTLVVKEMEDGTLNVSWDENDERYSMFNHLTEEELSAMLTKAMITALEANNE